MAFVRLFISSCEWMKWGFVRDMRVYNGKQVEML